MSFLVSHLHGIEPRVPVKIREVALLSPNPELILTCDCWCLMQRMRPPVQSFQASDLGAVLRTAQMLPSTFCCQVDSLISTTWRRKKPRWRRERL